MTEGQPTDKQKLGEALVKGTLNLADSDRPENFLLAGLRMIGALEERGETGLGFKIAKKLTVLLARSRFWTPEQINEALAEGKRIEQLNTEE
jgi:hypothetical protein